MWLLIALCIVILLSNKMVFFIIEDRYYGFIGKEENRVKFYEGFTRKWCIWSNCLI